MGCAHSVPAEPAPNAQVTTKAADSSAAAASSSSSSAVADVKKGKTPRVAVVYYSTYGHVRTLAERVAKGAKDAGADVTVYQFAETLPAEVLEKMHAAPKSQHPVVTPDDLVGFDAILMGIPTRYGQNPAQVKAFWDSTGQIWQAGKYVGKLISFFFSTATQGGGQETTAWTSFTHAVHHGMLIVPLGYTNPALFDNSAVHGGSPYGAGTIAGGMGERQPSESELGVAEGQGKLVANYAAAFVAGRK